MDEPCYCHDCKREFADTTSGGACPTCGGSNFTEISSSSTRDIGCGRERMQRTYTFGGQGAPQQQYPQQGGFQQAQQAQLSVAGFIQNAVPHQASNGNEYWKLTINGRTYNVWPEVPLEGIEIGMYVQGTYVESPNPRGGAPSKKLRSIQVMQPPAGTPPMQAPPQGGSFQGAPQGGSGGDSREAYWENRALRDNEKDLHVRREACWNTANALVANAIAAGVKFKDASQLREVTQTLAHEIETDVVRVEGFTSATNIQPGASAPVAVTEDELQG